MHRSRRDGFTLVEILIVVVIMGILAGILVPKWSHNSDQVRFSATVQSLQTVRGEIDVYRNQHQGRFPGVAGANPDTVLVEQLTLPTNPAGERSSSANQGFGDPSFPLGPYLRMQFPRNQFNRSTCVSTVTTFQASPPGGPEPGWIYEITSGRIRVNWNGPTPDGRQYWDI